MNPFVDWRKNTSNPTQIVYAGNVAWAHLCALKALNENPRQVGGEAYNVTDDTPPGTYTSLYEPFINGVGYKYTNFSIPYVVVFFTFVFMKVLFIILRPVVKLNIETGFKNMRMCTMHLTFTRKKIERLCGYKPLYNYQESLSNSVAYYKTIKSFLG